MLFGVSRKNASRFELWIYPNIHDFPLTPLFIPSIHMQKKAIECSPSMNLRRVSFCVHFRYYVIFVLHVVGGMEYIHRVKLYPAPLILTYRANISPFLFSTSSLKRFTLLTTKVSRYIMKSKCNILESINPSKATNVARLINKKTPWISIYIPLCTPSRILTALPLASKLAGFPPTSHNTFSMILAHSQNLTSLKVYRFTLLLCVRGDI